MNATRKIFLPALLIILPGCYAGSNFTIGASSLAQPVSFSEAIHNDSLQVAGPGDYTELGQFSLSFTEWSFGAPLSPNPSTDISKLLNDIVKKKGGNGITHLSVTVANSPVNFFSMVFRGLSYTALVIGGISLLDNKSDKLTAAEVVAGSLAGVLLLPAAAHFTLEGTVVKVEKKKN